jgi:hypothetical protein
MHNSKFSNIANQSDALRKKFEYAYPNKNPKWIVYSDNHGKAQVNLQKE